MYMWRPEIVKKPLSTRKATPYYFVRLWGIIAGEQVADTRYDGPGEPEAFKTEAEACDAVEAQLRRNFEEGKDSIEWSGQSFTTVASAMVQIRSNPLAESEAT